MNDLEHRSQKSGIGIVTEVILVATVFAIVLTLCDWLAGSSKTRTTSLRAQISTPGQDVRRLIALDEGGATAPGSPESDDKHPGD